MPKRELSKCRVWERERRERLKTCFEALDRVLPNHDPTVTSSKLEILQRAASHITELQRKNKELVLGDVQLQTTAQRDEVRKLRERVRKLSARAEQLAGLLRAAGLRIPKECIPNGIFRGPPRLWSGRVSKEKAEQLRTQHEQENDPKVSEANSPEKTNKRKRKRNTSPGKKSRNNGDLETIATTPITKKVAFSPRNTNNNGAKRANGINRRQGSTARPAISNTSNNTTTASQLSANGVAASVAAVLGPGTLILANGSVVPVPAPRVTPAITASRTSLPATLQRIQLVPVTTAPPPPVILMQRSSNTTNNTLTSKFANIQPKTASGKMNRPNLPRKVPIPVLRSNNSIAARKLSLQKQRKEKQKASTELPSSSVTAKNSTADVIEKSTSAICSTTTTAAVTATVVKSSVVKQKETKIDSTPSECVNVVQKNKDELPKILPPTISNRAIALTSSSKSEVPEKSNLLEGKNPKTEENSSSSSRSISSASDTLTTNQMNNKYTSEKTTTSVPSTELPQQKQKISIIKIEKLVTTNIKTVPIIENKPIKEVDKQSQEQKNNVQQIKKEFQVEQCRNQLQSIHTDEQVQVQSNSNSEENQLQSTNELQVNQIEHQENEIQQEPEQLNDQQHPDEHHSELSNDIFASLQDGTGTGVMGSQHTESMSPTAAFLLAFPLVSTLTGSGRGNDPTAHGAANGDGRTLNGSSGANGNNNNNSDDDGGRQGTPTTLLQIGGTITLDNNTNNINNNNNKQTNEEVPRVLDNFSYFNTRDNQQYSTIRDHTSTALEPIVSNTCLYEQQSHMSASSQSVALTTIGYNNDATDATYSNNLFPELRNTNNEHHQQTIYSSCLAKEKSSSKQRNNKNQQQQQQQYRAPVNWMTSPDVRPTYTHQHYQHASTPSSLGTADYFLPPFSDVYGSNSGSLDHNTVNDHPPFTWSPTTARSTLPTLTGDLALGVNPPSIQPLEQHQSKDIINQTAPFLSVSSLVNGNKQHRSKQQSTQQTKRHREKTNKSRGNNNNNSMNTSNSININNTNTTTTTSSTNTIVSNPSIITTSYMSNVVNTSTKRTENSSYIISGVNNNNNAKRTENIPYLNNSIKRIENSLYIENNLKRLDNNVYINNNPNSKRSYMDNNLKRNENTSYNDNKRSIVGGYSAEALISTDNTNTHNHLQQHESIYSSTYDQRTNNYILPSTIIPNNNNNNNGCVIDSLQHNNNQHNYQSHQSNQHQMQSNHLQQQHSQHQHHVNIHNSSTTFSANSHSQHRQAQAQAHTQPHSSMHNSHNNNNNNQQSSKPTFTQMTVSSTFPHASVVSLPNIITSSSFPHMSSVTATATATATITSTATPSFSHMNSPVTTSSSFGHMPSAASFTHHHPPPPPPLGAPPGEFSALLSAAVVDTYSKTFDSFVHVKHPVAPAPAPASGPLPPPPPPPLVSTLATTTITSSISTAGNFDSYCGSSTHNTRSHIGNSGESERRRHSSSSRRATANNNANTNVTASTFSELSFLTMSGAVSSPLLPDDYHAATAFLSNVPVPPPMPPAASSLTNFNLSAIFPEINKATSSLPISTWSSSSKISASSSRSQNRYHHQNQSHQQNHSHGHQQQHQQQQQQQQQQHQQQQQQQQQQRNNNHSVQSSNSSGYRQQHHQYHQQFAADPMYVAATNSTNTNNTNTSGTQFSSMLPHHQVQAFNSANSTGNGISTSIPGSGSASASGVDISTTSTSATFSFSFTTP